MDAFLEKQKSEIQTIINNKAKNDEIFANIKQEKFKKEEDRVKKELAKIKSISLRKMPMFKSKLSNDRMINFEWPT